MYGLVYTKYIHSKFIGGGGVRFFVLARKYPFKATLVQKSKIVGLS